MANITHKLTHIFTPPSGVALSITEAITGNSEFNFSQVCTVSANTQYHLAFTRANLQSVCLAVAGVAAGVTGTVTIYTNAASTGSPTDTIPLTLTASGGQVFEWTLQTNLLAKCPFSADVTTLYITNAATGPVTVSIYGLLNQ